MAKREKLTPYRAAANLGSLQREIVAQNPGAKLWGKDRNIICPILAQLNSLGHLLMSLGYPPSSEEEVIASEVVAACGNHSFISTRTGKAYQATEPDELRLMVLLEDYCKLVGLRGYEPDQVFDMKAWQAYEDANSVFKA